MGSRAKKDQSNEAQQAVGKKLDKSPRADEIRDENQQQPTGEMENGGQQAAGEERSETHRDEGREAGGDISSHEQDQARAVAQPGASGLSSMGGLASSLPSVPQTEPVGVSKDDVSGRRQSPRLPARGNPPVHDRTQLHKASDASPPAGTWRLSGSQQERDGRPSLSHSRPTYREGSNARDGVDAGGRQVRARGMPTQSTIGVAQFSPQDFQLFQDWVAREERKKAREPDANVRGSPHP
ncbi:hypothetical protein LY78DRAFT_390079 [Colletotrichum sublineola]|nr:hypothetical protein LY78DRAFT_390079 [Colletotrichum sublineola]